MLVNCGNRILRGIRYNLSRRCNSIPDHKPNELTTYQHLKQIDKSLATIKDSIVNIENHKCPKTYNKPAEIPDNPLIGIFIIVSAFIIWYITLFIFSRTYEWLNRKTRPH